MPTTCDCVKIAYRQDREGYLITFRLHPHDDHSELAQAHIGSQWQLVATPLDEDGNVDNAAIEGGDVE